MKRNFLLILALLLGITLVINSTKRISYLHTNAQKVAEEERKLEALKQENEKLKNELEYKKTDEFAEEEIRNKLGLAKEGEAVVILPRDDSSQSTVNSSQLITTPNYVKWWNLLFGS